MTIDELVAELDDLAQTQQALNTDSYVTAEGRDEGLRETYECGVAYLLEFIDDGRVMSEFNRLELP